MERVEKDVLLIPIILFFILWWIEIGSAIVHLEEFGMYEDWISNWVTLTDDYLIYTNTFGSFFFGCYAWSIILYYLDVTNYFRYMKLIILSFIFWFVISIFIGNVGAISYFNEWLFIHIIFGFWVGIGGISSAIMVIGNIGSHQLKYFKICKKKAGIFERYEASLILLILITLGINLSLFIDLNTVFILWAVIGGILIIFINYLFSKKKERDTGIKENFLLLRKIFRGIRSNISHLTTNPKNLEGEMREKYFEKSNRLKYQKQMIIIILISFIGISLLIGFGIPLLFTGVLFIYFPITIGISFLFLAIIIIYLSINESKRRNSFQSTQEFNFNFERRNPFQSTREFYFDEKIKIKDKYVKQDDIIKSVLQLLPEDYFISHGIPAFFKNNHVFLRNSYGLNVFLYYWLNDQDKTSPLITDVIKFLENIDEYIEYSTKILNFIYQNGRAPDKEEAWDLEIPIEEMDLLLELINIEIRSNVFNLLNEAEIKYYDEISKPIILAKKEPEEFKLENLIGEFDINFIDAIILPNFLNDLITMEDLDDFLAQKITKKSILDNEFNELNEYATKILKLKLNKEKEFTVLELARYLKASIMKTQEALYFLNNSENLINIEFSSEEINNISKLISKALRYCQNNEVELGRNLLISDFNLDLITSLRVIELYGKKFLLPEQISKKETKLLDQISLSTIKYIKEINESPAIDDLMIDLDINIRDASVIYAFINRISTDPLPENFEKISEKELLSIDDISCEILKIEKYVRKNNTLVDFAYQLNAGIYSAKRSLSYISWCENFYNTSYIENLSVKNKNVIHEKIKAALKYTKKNDLRIEFDVLIKEIGFNLKDTHLIIGLYNNIVSKRINVDTLTMIKKKKIEPISRRIFKAKKSGEILSYEPEEVFLLNADSTSLDDLWIALNYLKVKVLNLLMEKPKIIKTHLGKISAEREIQLKERHGIKVGKISNIELSKDTIKFQPTEVKFKSSTENVEMKRGIDFIGGLIRYKVVIKNNSEMLISNLELYLQMTADHIRTIDIKPRVYRRGDRAKIPNMSPDQSESIDFYLEPMICGSIPVSPVATYLDAYGKLHMLTRDRLFADSKCPPIINPGEENIAKVKNIYENNDIIRAFRSFELEHDSSRVFNLLREGIGAWAGKSVSKPIYENIKTFRAEVFYYVLNQNIDSGLGHKEQIIIKILVDEEKNIAMLSVGAEKNPTVNGVLTHIWELANSRIGEAFGYQFVSLHCPECGGSVDNMGKSQEILKCKYCGEKYEKRALKT
ncbi:hypothetical protein LCGC14_1224050 [marine sediment metagenome]|uniref:Uncharacterized protein n=1 Tax=marine sediment metagenome TaxID=412755 RepID=A0A0F9PEV6_9ZZZZ